MGGKLLHNKVTNSLAAFGIKFLDATAKSKAYDCKLNFQPLYLKVIKWYNCEGNNSTYKYYYYCALRLYSVQ